MPRKLNHSAGRRKGRDCRLGGWERVQFSGRLTWLLLVLLVLLVLLLVLLLLPAAACCCLLLPATACCYLLLPAAACLGNAVPEFLSMRACVFLCGARFPASSLPVCHSAAPPCTCTRCFNNDKQGGTIKTCQERAARDGRAPPVPELRLPAEAARQARG